MDDLGEPVESFVEFFRCVEHSSTPVPAPSTPFPPAHHAALLASSSRHGHLIAAAGPTLFVHALPSLRATPAPSPVARLDLSAAHDVAAVLSLALILDDAVLLVHASASASTSPPRPFVLLLSLPALVRGTILALPAPPTRAPLLAVATRPHTADDDTPVHSQFVALLSEPGLIDLYSVSANPAVPPEHALSLSGPDPFTCAALSPDDELLAVGSLRGSVAIHAADGLSLLATIVEVESGWHPFALHFIFADALLVSYAAGDAVSHVVWNLVTEDGELLVKGHSPLGELCFASPAPRPPSEDGEDHHQLEGPPQPPVIWCSRVPGWDMCVVASSLSTDIEVISLNDDGNWENWKFDEGKSPTLPTDEDDNDTKPVGIGFDLTDTAYIDSSDPSVPRIKPMPRLITFTTDLLLLPFVLIDDRADASCDFVREPLPLPPIPSVVKAIEKVTVPDLAPNVCEAEVARPNSKAGTIEEKSSTEQSNKEKPIPYLFGSGEDNLPGWNDVPNNSSSAPHFGSFVEATRRPPISRPETFSRVRKRDEFSSASSRDSASSVNSVTEEEDLEEAVTDATNDNSDISQIPQTPFPGQEGFLATFQDAGISETHSRGTGDATLGTLSLGFPPSARSRPGRSLPQRFRKPVASTVSTVSTPAYPQPPSLTEANAALKFGNPLDLIRSVLLEMAEELNNNRQVEQAMNVTLRETNGAILPLVETVRSGLADILQVLRDRFHDEAALRREVLVSLKRIMTLSRDYESASLEFRVREEEGFSSNLQAEDKTVDDQISRKEKEVLRSLAAIEERLNGDRILKERKISASGQVQQMYSSLSLQGIRVRKIHGMLSALAERIDDVDKGGRRTDLGLSMARLERLSISQKGTPGPSTFQGNGMMENAKDEESTFKAFSGVANELRGNVEGNAIAHDVQKVLRRLAMRAGRANISVKALQKRTRSTSNTQVGLQEHVAGVGLSDNDSRNRGENSSIVPNTSDEPGQKVGHSGTIEETSPPFFSDSGKPAFPSHPFSDVKTNSEKGVDGSSFSLRENSSIRFDGMTLNSKKEGWSTTFRASAPTESIEPLGGLFGRSGGASSKMEPSVQGSSPVPPRSNDFVTAKAQFSPPVFGGGGPLFAASGDGDHSASHDVFREPNESKKTFEPSVSDQPSPGSAGKKRTSDGESLTFESPQTEETSKKREKPPLVPSKPKLGTGASTVATLPPNDETTISSFGFSTHSVEKGAIVATLPPDDDLQVNRVAEIASLPPDDDLKKDLFASLPPDEDLKGSANAPVVSSDASQSNLIATLPPDDDLKGSMVATLPPDNDLVASQAGGKAKAIEGQQQMATLPSASNSTPHPFGTNRDKLNTGGTATGTLFGSKQASEGGSQSQTSQPAESLFGTLASQSQPLQFPFGSGQVSSTTGIASAPMRNPDNQVESSDDTDVEDNRSVGVFGMQATSMTSSMTGQSMTSAFGTNNSAPFGQADADLFGKANPQSAPFGVSSMQEQQVMNFGEGNSSAFASLGSSSSFASSNPFTATPQLVAPPNPNSGTPFGSSAQGGGRSLFGATSQLGRGPEFGASSQLGAGFGAQSQLGGYASPFGTPGGSAPVSFGSGVSGLGGGVPAPTFGQSNFGTPPQASFSAAGSGFGGGGGPSPFGAMSGGLFGGQGGGSSGFAALAGSQPFGTTAGSGFGNGTTPVFGNTGPPSFTSAAFSQRRA